MSKNSAARTGLLPRASNADKIESGGETLPSPARLARTSVHSLSRAVVRARWDIRCRRHRREDAERELEALCTRIADLREAADHTFAELQARDYAEAARVDEWTGTWIDGPDGPVANHDPSIRKAVR